MEAINQLCVHRHMECTNKRQGIDSLTEHVAFDTLFTRLKIFMKAVLCLVHWRKDIWGLEKDRHRSGPPGKIGVRSWERLKNMKETDANRRCESEE